MTWYRTGTVTVTNGSAVVTGAGTAFVASVRAGYGFVGPDGGVYEVDAVVSDTELTLASNYQGATAAGQTYRIFPTQSVIADLASSASELIDSFADVRDGVGAGLHPDGSAATPAIRFAADQDTGIYRVGANSLGFSIGGVTRALFSSEGLSLLGNGVQNQALAASRYGYSATYNVTIVGATAGNASVAIGVDPFDNAGSNFAGDGSEVLFRNGVRFITPNAANSTFLLSVISMLDGKVGIGTATPAEKLTVAGNIAFSADNTYSLGTAALRASVVYAGTGTINTSDEREKLWRGELTDAEYEAGLQVIAEIGVYQFTDAVAEKGADAARYHFGVRAQQVWAIFAEHGLVDPITGGKPGATPYGFLCFDEWDAEELPAQQASAGAGDADEQPIPETSPTEVIVEAGDRYGIRPDELAMFLLAVQARRQAEIEARIAALETTAS